MDLLDIYYNNTAIETKELDLIDLAIADDNIYNVSYNIFSNISLTKNKNLYDNVLDKVKKTIGEWYKFNINKGVEFFDTANVWDKLNYYNNSYIKEMVNLFSNIDKNYTNLNDDYNNVSLSNYKIIDTQSRKNKILVTKEKGLYARNVDMKHKFGLTSKENIIFKKYKKESFKDIVPYL